MLSLCVFEVLNGVEFVPVVLKGVEFVSVFEVLKGVVIVCLRC